MRKTTNKIVSAEEEDSRAGEVVQEKPAVVEVGEELAAEEVAFRTNKQQKIELPPVKADDWKAGYRALVGLMTVVGQEQFGQQLPGKKKVLNQKDEWPPLAA